MQGKTGVPLEGLPIAATPFVSVYKHIQSYHNIACLHDLDISLILAHMWSAQQTIDQVLFHTSSTLWDRRPQICTTETRALCVCVPVLTVSLSDGERKDQKEKEPPRELPANWWFGAWWFGDEEVVPQLNPLQKPGLQIRTQTTNPNHQVRSTRPS